MKRFPRVGEIIKIANKKGPLVVVDVTKVHSLWDGFTGDVTFDTIPLSVLNVKQNPKVTTWQESGNIDVYGMHVAAADITLMGKIKLKKTVTVLYEEQW